MADDLDPATVTWQQYVGLSLEDKGRLLDIFRDQNPALVEDALRDHAFVAFTGQGDMVFAGNNLSNIPSDERLAGIGIAANAPVLLFSKSGGPNV
ncbi:MAG: hypothetical protein EOM20_21025 [Spartobacteria bacterium]|nr:hypothetical protein [Spartobacteria bacterium]